MTVISAIESLQYFCNQNKCDWSCAFYGMCKNLKISSMMDCLVECEDCPLNDVKEYDGCQVEWVKPFSLSMFMIGLKFLAKRKEVK